MTYSYSSKQKKVPDSDDTAYDDDDDGGGLSDEDEPYNYDDNNDDDKEPYFSTKEGRFTSSSSLSSSTKMFNLDVDEHENLKTAGADESGYLLRTGNDEDDPTRPPFEISVIETSTIGGISRVVNLEDEGFLSLWKGNTLLMKHSSSCPAFLFCH